MKVTTIMDSNLNYKLWFKEKPLIKNSDLDADYCTTIQFNKYSIKLMHCFEGVGMSDKYISKTYIEIFDGDDNITEHFVEEYGIDVTIPVEATTQLLFDIIKTFIIHLK